MNEFMGPPLSWYEPPASHEVDNCEDCHVAGYHRRVEAHDWAYREGCFLCAERLERATTDNDYCLPCKKWYCEEQHGSQEPSSTPPN